MKKTYYVLLSLLLPLASTPVLQATQQKSVPTKLQIVTTVATLCLASSLPKNLSYPKSNIGFSTIQPFQKNDQQHVHLLQNIDSQNVHESQLPLWFEKGWTLEKLAKIPFDKQYHYIHIISSQIESPICYIGSIGLKGGGNGPSTTKSNDSDNDTYSAPSTPPTLPNFTSTDFNRTSLNDFISHQTSNSTINNAIENYIETTCPLPFPDHDTDNRNDSPSNTSRHSTPSPKLD